jgi:hypothetical protein
VELATASSGSSPPSSSEPILAEDLTCFKLGWPYAQAAAAIELRQDWAPDAPDELAASLLITATGDLDEPVVTIFGAMLGTETETANTLDHLIVRLDADRSRPRSSRCRIESPRPSWQSTRRVRSAWTARPRSNRLSPG